MRLEIPFSILWVVLLFVTRFATQNEYIYISLYTCLFNLLCFSPIGFLADALTPVTYNFWLVISSSLLPLHLEQTSFRTTTKLLMHIFIIVQ